MDGWMGVWIDRWMSECMGGWLAARIEIWMGAWIHQENTATSFFHELIIR